MAFRMQCVQFQSQALSDPDESLHSPLPSEPSASGQQTEDPASVDGAGAGGGGTGATASSLPCASEEG